jgi:hypothetical protein
MPGWAYREFDPLGLSAVAGEALADGRTGLLSKCCGNPFSVFGGICQRRSVCDALDARGGARHVIVSRSN